MCLVYVLRCVCWIIVLCVLWLDMTTHSRWRESVMAYYIIIQGRVDDLPFFDYSSPFCFSLLNFIVLLSFIIKYYNIMFIIIVFWLEWDTPAFIPTFASFHTNASLLTFFVCFFTLFNYFVPMRECLGKHSCLSSTFPIVILNGTCF